LAVEKNSQPLFSWAAFGFSGKPETYRLLVSPFPAGAIAGLPKPVRRIEFRGALSACSNMQISKG
jgi:hypothetical protein